MCLMEVFTHATCGHRTDVLINSCLFSALIGRACSPNHRRVAGFLTTKSQRYCRRCYDTGVSNIRVDYGIWYRDIVLYAWGLGKNVSDVRERLTALETDERARLEEWAMECGRRERAKEGRVGLCERCCFCCDQWLQSPDKPTLARTRTEEERLGSELRCLRSIQYRSFIAYPAVSIFDVLVAAFQFTVF